MNFILRNGFIPKTFYACKVLLKTLCKLLVCKNVNRSVLYFRESYYNFRSEGSQLPGCFHPSMTHLLSPSRQISINKYLASVSLTVLTFIGHARKLNIESLTRPGTLRGHQSWACHRWTLQTNGRWWQTCGCGGPEPPCACQPRMCRHAECFAPEVTYPKQCLF